ncbi:MAG TPA: anhydro-N-acetylmuramic acid kinase [Nitrospinae bacterium]|nr:anhydro-N-acetylmuramic acid kinase [Nitrospinota bacterium]
MKKIIKAIGLMSGTSADGVDAAIVEIKGKGLDYKASLITFKKFQFSKDLRELIHKVSTPEYGRVDLICQLNFLIGELFAKAAIGVVKKAGYKMRDIDLIGSHGQTIYHMPKGKPPSTLQIGEPSVIAERTGVTTIADFRTMDIAAGGLGAPLTPFAHYILFRKRWRGIAVNNIGGISNVTFIPAGGDINDVIAFDTGPGNMLIDSVMHIITKGKYGYDKNGEMARKGKDSERFLEKLMKHPFIKARPPKSTGREEFGYNEALKFYKFAKRDRLSDEDIVATTTRFTAKSIVENYKRFILCKHDVSEVIVCGGGAKNPILIDMISREIKPIKVKTSDSYGFPPETIEAIVFAILGYAAISGIPANLPHVTGAGKQVVLGKIIPAKTG